MMEYRYFSSDPAQRTLAASLYEPIKKLPLICPHGHVDPRLLADESYDWGTPVDLLIIPDHYIFRMLYSQGISLESLGIPRLDGEAVESDHRKIWQTVCDHWHLFRGTPTGIWLRDELTNVFGISEKMNAQNAQTIYDAIAEKLKQPEFRPRALFERFNIEVLATTDAATFNVVGRDSFAATSFRTSTSGGWLTIDTGSLTLRYRVGSGSFAADNLTVQLKAGQQTVQGAPWAGHSTPDCALGKLCEAESLLLS